MRFLNSRGCRCVSGLAAVFLFVGLWCSVGTLRAQSIYGQIGGTVTDPHGGTIAAAKIRVVEQNTKLVREVESDAIGAFRVANLDAGLYTITVRAAGFADAERKD